MLLATSSMFMNQLYTLNDVSLKRNTHKTGLHVDQLTKNLQLSGH